MARCYATFRCSVCGEKLSDRDVYVLNRVVYCFSHYMERVKPQLEADNGKKKRYITKHIQ